MRPPAYKAKYHAATALPRYVLVCWLAAAIGAVGVFFVLYQLSYMPSRHAWNRTKTSPFQEDAADHYGAPPINTILLSKMLGNVRRGVVQLAVLLLFSRTVVRQWSRTIFLYQEVSLAFSTSIYAIVSSGRQGAQRPNESYPKYEVSR